MEQRPLGRTGLSVPAVCLGTMTWGQQNTEQDAHRQLDYALDQGVTFIDAAEMYPVPPKAETAHRTEAYLGSWLGKRTDRDRILLATKIAGPSKDMTWIRGGSGLDRANIEAAVDASLKRLQTDFIDLYQLHWPARAANYFGRLGYHHKGARRDGTPIAETLDALARVIAAGKVRMVGLSNETAWGAMTFLKHAESGDLPRMVSIQNPYNLLNRSFEVGLAEVSHREDLSMLAYSPLAMGVLTGKYMDGARPEGARLSAFTRFKRYDTPRAHEAAAAYVGIAREAGLDPAAMALAYVTSRPFVTSTIIGATDMDQLKADIAGAQLTLSDDVLERIEQTHRIYTYPAP